MSVTPWYKLQLIFGDAGVCCVAPLLEDLLHFLRSCSHAAHLRALEAAPRQKHAPKRWRAGDDFGRESSLRTRHSPDQPMCHGRCRAHSMAFWQFLTEIPGVQTRPTPSRKKREKWWRSITKYFHHWALTVSRWCSPLAKNTVLMPRQRDVADSWPWSLQVRCDQQMSMWYIVTWWILVICCFCCDVRWGFVISADVWWCLQFFFTFRFLYIPSIPSREGFVSSGIKLRFQAARIISGEGWDQQQSSQRREFRCRPAVARSEKGDWTDLNSSRYFEEMWVKMSWFLHPALDWQYRKMFFTDGKPDKSDIFHGGIFLLEKTPFWIPTGVLLWSFELLPIWWYFFLRFFSYIWYIYSI